MAFTSTAQVQEYGWQSEGAYITTTRLGHTIGDTIALSGYTVVQYLINEDSTYTISFTGNSLAGATVVAAAWYSSTTLSSDSYLGPALEANGKPMELPNVDGDYEITAPEGAVMLVASRLRYVGDVSLFHADGSRIPIKSFAEKHAPDEYISGTLPVMYITTADSAAIVSKNYYIQASYYLDNLGLEGFDAIGSKESPLTLQIKGRGNASWKGEKKPYRIKLDKKQPLMGLKKNKHFCLMSHAQTASGYQHDEMGFALSAAMELDWSPQQRPIELVLNGDYIGIYWVSEKIRVDNDRVNIVEQADEETDPELITGGWLIEIDNYDDEAQIQFTESNGNLLRVTYHTPEVLSQEQHDYLSNLITTCDSLIYVSDKTSREWENYIDIDELAKFYVLHEIVDNCEAFSGSCYWHKERGEDTKLKAGPVWDFGNVASHARIGDFNHFIYQETQTYVTSHWIEEICKFPHFQEKVREVWRETYPNKVNAVKQHCLDYVDYIIPAVAQDYKRWNNPNSNNMAYRKVRIWNFLIKKWAFLEQQWDDRIFVLGQVNGNDWNPAVGVEMETADGVTYTAEVVVSKPESNETELKADSENLGYFSFSKRLADTSDDWDAINYFRIGASSDNELDENGYFNISKDQYGQNISLEQADEPHAFSLVEGKYTFTIDRTNMTLQVAASIPTAITDVNGSNEVKAIRYYNLQGIESKTAFDGINIVVKEMTDGSKVVTKKVIINAQ